MAKKKSHLNRMLESWTFWLTVAFLLFFGDFIIPSWGLMTVSSVVVLFIGWRFFLTDSKLEVKDIVSSTIITGIVMFVFVLFSLRQIAAMPFLKLVFVGLLIDFVTTPIKYGEKAYDITRIAGTSIWGRVLGRFLGVFISVLIVFWAFDKEGIFLVPFVTVGQMFKMGWYPVVTIIFVIIKIVGFMLA